MADVSDGSAPTSSDLAEGGYFTPAGRAAAIAESLPLVSSYFVAGRERHKLDLSPTRLALDPAADRFDTAIAGLRLRAALVAGSRLADIADLVLNRPTFRYEVISKESVGVVSGRLDSKRWITERHAITAPRTYPILWVERSHSTAENRLLAKALSLLSEDLEQALFYSSAPAKSLEMKQAETVLTRLSQIARAPLLARLLQRRDKSDHESLIDIAHQVERRIDSGRVANPDPYRQLVAWIRSPRDAGMVAGADIDWSFYGSTFDTDLFELWCMKRLADGLTEFLGEPIEVPDFRGRPSAKTFVWETELEVVCLHFQRPLKASTAHGTVVWKYPNDVGFGGRPDLTISISDKRRGQPERFIYVDPKLRQRAQMPAEEMYKLLGYFLNAGYGARGKGAILTYAPQPLELKVRRLHTDEGGLAIAVSLDPERDTASAPGFEAILQIVKDEVSD